MRDNELLSSPVAAGCVTRGVVALLASVALLAGCSSPTSPAPGKGPASGGGAKNQGATDDEALPDGAVGKGKSTAKPLGPIPEGPVATIDGDPITREAFIELHELKRAKYAERGREMPAAADRRYRRSLTERLIYEELLKREAQKLGVDYDPAALEQRKLSQRRGIQDWATHLVRRGESDKSLDAQYIAELRERAILTKQGALTVTDADIDAEYEKVRRNYIKDAERIRASHILVQIGPDPHGGGHEAAPTDAQKKEWEEAAIKRANEIHAKVTAPGADFASIANEESDSPTRSKGGDLGMPFTADRMPAEFSEVAFALKPGEISKPIVTKFGVHIVKLVAKYPPGELPRDALADQIRDRLSNQRFHKGRRDLRDRLYKDYKVVNLMAESLGPEPTPVKPSGRGNKGAAGDPHANLDDATRAEIEAKAANAGNGNAGPGEDDGPPPIAEGEAVPVE